MSEYDVYFLPMSEIYSNANFNSRKDITFQSVQSLAESIRDTRLQTPITVREQPGLPEGKKYQIVAGHRRYAAFKLLERDTIPSFIDNCTDHEANVTNLSENIDRKDLTILEEARAIQKTFPEDVTAKEIGAALKRTPAWVMRRLFLLELSDEIQQLFHTGQLIQTDLEFLRELDEVDRDLAAKQLLQQKGTAKKRRRLNKAEMRKHRKVPQNLESIRLMVAFLVKMNITGLPTKLLLWSLGEITTEDIEKEIWKACKENPVLLLYDEGKSNDYKKAYARIERSPRRRKG